MKDKIYKVINKDNLKIILNEFILDFYGIHGYPHWCRIIDNGYLLQQNYNIDMDIIIGFAFFHDLKRKYEEYDYNHGLRGADFLINNKDLINVDDHKIKIIYEACKGHTDIKFSNELNIAACWDSDRLDLMRVDILPQSPYLNLEISKQIDFIKERSNIAKLNKIPNWGIEILEDLNFKIIPKKNDDK